MIKKIKQTILFWLIKFHLVKQAQASAKVIQFPRLKTFAETFSIYSNFKCDGSCHSDNCAHVFVFQCPGCRKPIRANFEEMGIFAGASPDAVCQKCWENKELIAA